MHLADCPRRPPAEPQSHCTCPEQWRSLTPLEQNLLWHYAGQGWRLVPLGAARQLAHLAVLGLVEADGIGCWRVTDAGCALVGKEDE